MIYLRYLCGFVLAAAICVPGVAASSPTILVVGDSLSSAYGMSDRQGWVNLLQDRLDDNGYPHEVVNASISGDTTQNALSRLDTTLERHRPDIVIVELGGNDGLRAFPVKTIERNLTRILKTVRENGAKILLAGIRIPPNYGPAYAEAFQELYPVLAEKFDTALIPFFMAGVADDPDLMQDDGIHPNAAAQPLLLENVWPVLEPFLEEAGQY
jgi:acyl-CoA thioesterase-1